MSSFSSLFRYIPQDTFLHKLDPRVKMLWFFSVIIPAAAWSDPIFMSAIVMLVIIYGKIAKDSVSAMLKAIVLPFPAYGMVLLFNLLAFDFTVKSMVSWNIQYLGWLIPRFGPFGPFGHVSVESLVFTLGVCLRVAVFVLASRLFLLFTSPSDIVTAFSKFKVPLEMTTAISVAFGYLPELARQVTTIMEAQRSRGWQTGSKNPVTATRSFVPVVVPIVLRSMVRAEFLATAITSRGFGATTKPITLRETKFSATDVGVTVVLLAFIAAASLIGAWYLNIASFRVTTFLLRNAFFKA
jgi:energy-coupling factor transport system permease protein